MEYKVRIRHEDHHIYVVDGRVHNDTVASNTTEMTVTSDTADAHAICRLAYKQYATRNYFPETELNNQYHGFDRDGVMWVNFPGDHLHIMLYVEILNGNTAPSPQ